MCPLPRAGGRGLPLLCPGPGRGSRKHTAGGTGESAPGRGPWRIPLAKRRGTGTAERGPASHSAGRPPSGVEEQAPHKQVAGGVEQGQPEVREQRAFSPRPYKPPLGPLGRPWVLPTRTFLSAGRAGGGATAPEGRGANAPTVVTGAQSGDPGGGSGPCSVSAAQTPLRT